ncbi:hypothetical protein DAPPUDRAFT_116453 [Daphnia pulex]|uniref:Uncharacterized protein n=1 Tax=Daphnia pulex TaxID=6669 RepID=E9HPF2_DAPPU|nr:hypothetical protein DAPPUDRAFT_116453 [Daphnia pulex]|eukprot:EFX66382.1 hypothetical protein DAPPUDRAFT_116453 [Daphnia pulex]
MALNHYRNLKETADKFKGSEGTDKLTMNKTVDVLNGRYFAEGISNNIIHNDKNNRAVEDMKWATLNAILTVLDITEKERESRLTGKTNHDPNEEIEEDGKQAKLTVKDKLLTVLSIRYGDHIENQVSSSDVTNDELIYDICGYLPHSGSQVLECLDCVEWEKVVVELQNRFSEYVRVVWEY